MNLTKNALARFGVYTGSDGFQKVALVVGTRKSTAKDTEVPRPDKGHVNVLVFSQTGKQYVRHNVLVTPETGLSGTIALLDAEQAPTA